MDRIQVERTTPDLRKKFWERVSKSDDEAGCWEWIGGKMNGYGRMKIDGVHLVQAHRLSYVLHYGDVPTGLIVCHKCNNRSCVRPDHLYAGTYKDNFDDMARAGNAFDISSTTNHSPARGARIGVAMLTDSQVIEIYRLIREGARHRDLAARFGVGKTTITNIASGRSWGWLTRSYD